ncbi:MAG: hypothetical protein ABIH00_07285 [Armatimonadota bacterium]
MDRWDILSRINDFAQKHHIPVNNVKQKITKEVASEFSRLEEDSYLDESVIENAFDKVMKDFMEGE